MKRTALAAAICLASACAQAGFVDGRSSAAGAEVEVAFKSITLADLADELVPAGYQVSFSQPELRKKQVRIFGKAKWQTLLYKAGADSGFRVIEDEKNKTVRILAIGEAVVAAPNNPGVPTATTSVVARAPAPAPQAPPAKVLPPVDPAIQNWDVRLEDRSIHGTLLRWAKQAKPQRQIAWELPREFIVAASDSGAPFNGTFEQAVDRLLDSFDASDYPPKGCFYANDVVRVVRRIGDGMECER